MRRELIYAALVLALVVAAAIGGYALRDGAARTQAAAAQRSVEAERAAHEGLSVATTETIDALESRVARLAGERDGLAAQLAAAKRAAPTARPARVAELVSEGRASGAPREETTIPADTEPPVGAGHGPPPSCLLAEGDGLRVRALDVTLRSDAGTEIAAGVAEVWRTSAGETLLYRGPWSATASRVAAEPPTRARSRWAASADLGISPAGYVYAAAVERRVAGPVWVGLAGGAVGEHGYVAGRLRWEWGR